MRNRPTLLHIAPALLALAFVTSTRELAAAQSGQPADAPPPAEAQPPTGESGQERRISIDDLPPARRLGVRAEIVRQSRRVHPVVVVVPHSGAYIEAIGRWTLDAYFPVLIDDGTDLARENIGRFVRAFAPEAVLTWRGSRPGASSPPSPDEVAGRVERAVSFSWGANSYADLLKAWISGEGHTPPGIVLAARDDPSWTSALALCAGRGQPMIWLPPMNVAVGGAMHSGMLGQLSGGLFRALDQVGLDWRRLGDDIDALTVCGNLPSKVETPDDRVFAFTDMLGRLDNGSRFAWVGLVHGDEQTAAYRAMCALFLQPETAWLFDGYADEAGFRAFSTVDAVPLLQKAGLNVLHDGRPDGGVNAWRRRIVGGIDAGFIHINTAGMRRWFKLEPGRAYGSDIPVLRVPAIVHFIHSFSAQNVSDPESLAGRWFIHGAYAYAGSVDEPFLNAFIPPGQFVGRMLSGEPFGTATRIPDAATWKIATYGDPLITLGPRARRTDGRPNLPAVDSLEDSMRSALAERRFDEALASLVMLGRDETAVQLVRALAQDQTADITADVALVAVHPVFRAADADLFLDLYALLSPYYADQTNYKSLLWQMMRPRLPATSDPEAVALMAAHTLEGSLDEDIAVLAQAMNRTQGREAARAMLFGFLQQKITDRVRRTVERLLEQY